MTDRYDTTGNPEDEYYPGTSVLINLEGIRDPEALLERETELQLAAYEELFTSFEENLTPDLPFFYYLHHKMFSPLFVWAGRPRTVGISKGGTPFRPPSEYRRGDERAFLRVGTRAMAGRTRPEPVFRPGGLLHL